MNLKGKRIFMTVIGVFLSGFSAGMFDFTGFGMDPFQVFAHGIWMHTPLSFGTLYTILNIILILFAVIADRHKIGLGTIINLFLLGYVVQFSSWLFKNIFPDAALAIRIIVLIAAVVIMCFGSALYFTADMGVSTYDAIALVMHEKLHWQFRLCRIGTDLICVIIGFLLGAVVGVGTLVTAFFMGPLISFFQKKVSEPMLHGKNAAVSA